MVRKNLEEIDSGNLLLVLGAIVKNYVFAVDWELEDGFSDVLTTEVGDHTWTKEQNCWFLLRSVPFLKLLQGFTIISDDLIHLFLLLLLKSYDSIGAEFHPCLLHTVIDVLPCLACQNDNIVLLQHCLGLYECQRVIIQLLCEGKYRIKVKILAWFWHF